MTSLSSDDVAVPRVRGASWSRWLVVAGPLAVVVAVVAVLVSGAFTSAFAPVSDLADAGTLVRWGLPVVTVVTHLASAVTLGALVAAAALVGPGAAQRVSLNAAGIAAGVWALVGVAGLVVQYADISAIPFSDPDFGSGLWNFVTTIPVGQAGAMAVVLAALTSGVALAVRSATGAIFAVVLPLAAFAYQSSTGHAAGAASHTLAVSGMYLHLVGAALWVGGLAAIAILVVGRSGSCDFAQDDEKRDGRGNGSGAGPAWVAALPRFSVIATWCLVVVGYSGIVSGWIRLASPSQLVTTRYGVLILVKAVLLAGLGVLGWLHRRRVISRIADDGGAARRGLFARLAGVELLVMGAVMGVAVALGSSAPPVPDDIPVDTSPAYQLTGYPLPPEPTASRWLSEWRLEPIVALACVAAVVAYIAWVRRLARRGDRWPVGRTVAWCLGVVIIAWVTNGGPAVYGDVLFSGHMVAHMVLALLVPMLLVLAAPVTLLLRAVPRRTDGSRGPREWALAFVHSRWGRFVAHPVVSAGVFVAGMLVFYYTPLFEWSLRSHVGHLWMIVHFTLAGYLFANALIGIDPGPHRPAYPQRLVLLFATMAFHAFFGVALMMQTSLLAPDWFGNMGRPWGASAIEDQQTGGDIAWGIGELPTLVLAITVAVMWTRSDEREARRRDRKADRDGDAELEEYNAMLARMAGRGEPPSGAAG